MKPKYFSSRLIFLAMILSTLLSVPITASAGTITQITTNTAVQYKPEISGNRIVWTDYRNGNSDIYMYEINTPPVADAGPDQVIDQVNTPVYLDGVTNSYDANLDPLTFSWSFTTRPAGSWAFIEEPLEGLATFTADKLGSYMVSLTVNDGIVDSPTVMIEVLVIKHDEMASNILMEVVEGINALNDLSPDVFRNKGSAKKLNKKVGEVIKKIAKGEYKNALDKVNWPIDRLDGCALRGHLMSVAALIKRMKY